MTIEPFCANDIASFLALAKAENWISEPWEIEFLLSEFPQGCFVAKTENGETAGFVTSLRHERSAWIGNLIVAPKFRSKGIGKALFQKVLEALFDCGVETVWLTASKSGAPLYEKFGFTRIDTINRWVGSGRQRRATHDSHGNRTTLNFMARAIDCRGWGDRRDVLFEAVDGRGKFLPDESGFAVIQPCGDACQVGPFSALDVGTAERLLDRALCTIPVESSACLDAPASNRAAARMLKRRRFIISGTTELMYSGVKPAYLPEYIYGLATMGSCG